MLFCKRTNIDKKTNRKTGGSAKSGHIYRGSALTSLFSASLLLSTLLTGCFDPVFSSIRKEVELEEANISGFINSIVRFTDTDEESGTEKEYLYLQNGRIYFKEISDENGGLTKNAKNKGWTHDSSFKDPLKYNFDDSEYSGYYTHRLAADDKYIYALAYTPVYNETYSRNEPKDIHLYCSSKVKGEWEEVTAVSKAIENYISHLKNTNFMMDASIQLFCTNSPKKEHRKAFIRIGGGSPYYSDQSSNYEQNYGVQEAGNYGIIPLNGTSTDVNTPVPFGTNGATHKTLSAVYFEDDDGDPTNNVHFFNTSASDTNETRNDEATYVYYGSEETLKSFAVSDYKAHLDETVKVLDFYYEKSEDGKTTTEHKETTFEVNKIDASINNLYVLDSDGETAKTVSAPDDVIKETTGADSDIISLCVTKTSVLIGTDQYGVYRAMLTDGKPTDKTKDFDNNASTIMTKPYIVRVLLCTDPSIGEEEEGSALYGAMDFHYTQSSASADYDNVGLWSYYHSRGNWNRE